ncbi:MAG: hypothetical protein ACE5M4_04645 [Anaerolineales bacterium]
MNETGRLTTYATPKNLDVALLFLLVIGGATVVIARGTLGDGAASVASLEVVEFLISVGIGWVLQRLYSREQFRKELQSYGYSAYRRINDMRRSVTRFDRQVKKRLREEASSTRHVYELFQEIANSMSDTVRSSVADWAEIVGDEILRAERLRDLELEKASTEASSEFDGGMEADETIQQVEQEISRLRDDLPLYLQLAVQGQSDILPRGGRKSRVIEDHFNLSDDAIGGILLEVQSFAELTDDAVALLRKGVPYAFYEDVAAGTSHLVLVDRDSKELGEIINSFEDSGVYHRDFIETLRQSLPPWTPKSSAGGMPFEPLPGAKIHTLNRDTGRFYLLVPVSRTTSQEEAGASENV